VPSLVRRQCTRSMLAIKGRLADLLQFLVADLGICSARAAHWSQPVFTHAPGEAVAIRRELQTM